MMARTKWIFGGQQPSQPTQDLKPTPEPIVCSADAKKFGYENFGNTCYANSVLQALYFCAPFRDLVIQTADPSISRDLPSPVSDVPPKSPSPQLPLAPVRRKPERKASTSGNPPDTLSVTPLPPHPIPISPPTLFSALRSLFLYISTHPGDRGTVAPKAFIDKLKEGKEDFRGTMHQDAHEFLNHLLNMIVEEIEEDKKAQNNALAEDLNSSLATLASKAPPTIVTATTSSNSGTSPQDATLVHRLFEGALTSETRCLTCETVSSRDESFLDLSIDIEQNSSVTACLRSFSASEMLCQRNKFFCDACCDLQEAEKRMKIKKLPNVLALHLKRFKFQEDVQKYIKLTYRVAFPHELRLFNTVDDLENADRLYNLFAIVVHIGNGPHHGHYISIVKSAGTWLVFDDDNVYPIPESDIPKYYGDSNSGSAYVLYYQAADIDLVSLGLKTPEPLLLPQPQTESNESQPRTPSQHTQQLAPSLPPGLSKTESNDVEASIIVTPPPPVAPPVTSTPVQEKSTGSPFADNYPSPLRNGSPSVPSATMAPPPSSITRGIFAPVRRATSSHGRPSTATLSVGGSDQSMYSESTPRSPRHSASSPMLAVLDDSSPVPPVPPLPSLTPTTPVVTAHLNGKPREKDKEKEKDKSRKESKPSGWFKRRSFKLGEKSKSEKSEKSSDDIPPSPVSRDERSSSASWFKSSSQVKRRPSQVVVLDHLRKVEDGLSTKLDPPQAITTASSNTSSNVTQQDGSSSSGPSIILSSPPTTISSSPPPLPPKLSTFSSKSSPSSELIESPPTRKSSLVSTSRTRGSIDQQWKSVTTGSSPYAGQRPATVAGSLPIPNGIRQFSPIPNSPSSLLRNHALPPVPLPVVNGAGPIVSEPESIYLPGVNGHAPGQTSENNSQSDFHQSQSLSASASSLHASHPTSPPSSTGFTHSSLNQSVVAGSALSSGGGFKRAKRKLSLTAPLLGLGKKDKDRDRDRDREEKEGRKERFFYQAAARPSVG